MQKMRNHSRTTILFFLILAFFHLYAGEVSSDDIQTAARRWIAANAIFKSELPDAEPVLVTRMTNADGLELPLWHVKLSPSGYLIMSSDDTLPPVVAFDTKASYSKLSPTPLPLMLDKQGEIFQQELAQPQTRGNHIAQENQARWKTLLSPTRADSTTPSTIITPPMLETEWDQDSPYNFFSPSYSSYNTRSVAGCVPIAIAQILKYHEWPIAGNETKTYHDAKGTLKATLKADFSFPFEWNLIENKYDPMDETNATVSELAVARLAMEMGILVNANYESGETGAFIDEIKDYLHQYLGYSSEAQYGYASSNNILALSVLYERLHVDMVEKRPALVSYTQGNSGHLFVADGLGTINNLNYYHFNYGWGGSQNGWYLLTDGYKETIVTEAITNITPAPVPCFRQTSCQKTSTFLLSWDFPAYFTAEAFRLTRTSKGISTVINSSIDGTANGYALIRESGTNVYTLEAKVNGKWQAPSAPIVISIVNNPAKLPVLTYDEVLESTKGAAVTTNIASSVPLAGVSVTSSRPDILPDSAISVTGSDTSWILELAPESDSFGNVLLYLTATDTVGNIVKQTILLRVKGLEPLFWHDYFEDALQKAQDTSKMILLVEDNSFWSDYSDFCNGICEIDDIKEYLLDNYVLWYASWDFDWDSSRYTSDLYGVHPYAVIINPKDTSHRMRGICNPSEDEFRMFLNLDTPEFSLDDEETYSLGTTYKLQISCFRKGAVIHYRLDGKSPTLSDQIYTDPIPLTENTTVSAQAFLNGEPIGETVTQYYVFERKLVWYDSFAKVCEIANDSGKLILLVEDTSSSSSSSWFCTSICEIDDIMENLLDNYVLWYVDWRNDEESYQFTRDIYGSHPYAVIIAPETGKRIRWANDPTSDECRLFLDMDSLLFSLDDEEIYVLGETEELEISILQRNAVIHYRLDSGEPSTADLIYTDTLSLSETTTVSARAFLNGEPLGDAVSKTYTFLPQVSTPKLQATPSAFFTSSSLLMASCDTPDVTIRYRTDGWVPTQSSPVFPDDGLTITESCEVVVRAFKEDMKASNVARCKLTALSELPDANEFTKGEGITIYSTTQPWILQTDTFHSSPSAMRSAAIADGESTSMVAKVSGSGVISFYWKVSSEYADKLSFNIDGKQQNNISSLTDWSQQYYNVSGDDDHYLEWTYSKDYSISSNSDCAWVDDIVWKSLVSIVIDGEDAIESGETKHYECKTIWSDGSVSNMSTTWTLSSTDYASIDGNGNLNNENTSDANQMVTLNATCDFAGMSFMASKDILLSNGLLQHVETPVLNVDETAYFTGSLHITADCETPASIIRYTLDGSLPVSSSPVFPEDGLDITDSAILTVKAFKEGMISSDCAQSRLIALMGMASFASGDGILFGFMDSPWFLQTTIFNSAPSAMQSAAISDSESTSLIAKVTGPGTLAFYWKVSSEESFDKLSFSIDGIQQNAISGDTDWCQKSYTISGEGEHYLTWTYSKDSLWSKLSDCAWIDDVSWIKAENVTPESAFEYILTNGVATITKFTGSQTDISIPASIAGYPVVAIGDSAFEKCTKLKSVAIPTGVTAIETEAFYYCSDLISISIPNSISSIGVRTFCGCRKLDFITIPASVKSIGDFAFGYCINLKSFLVDADNSEYTSIDGVLFSKDMSTLIQYPNAKDGVHYDVPAPVVQIGNGAFSDCSSLSSIHIPNGVVSIGSEAFQFCNNLEELILPDSVTSIGGSAFGYCTKFKSIIIPASVTSLEMYTFNNCRGLESINLPNKLTTISWHAFYSCSNLTTITIPEHTETISSNAFEGCTKLKDVEFKGGVPSLKRDSFPTPITFHVFPDKGWEDFVPPARVTVLFDMSPKLTLTLSRGWNLCSMPFIPDEESNAKLQEAGSVFWGWENGRFKQLDTFLPGQGFWMYVQSACELKLKGMEGDAVPLRKGWNLVGPTPSNPSFGNATVWGMEGKQMVHVSTSNVNKWLQQGKGYWILVK